jgi:hypothetical protein
MTYSGEPIGETLNVQFRAEALNAFNTPRFGNPNTSVTSSSFGVITSQANAPRQIQFGLKRCRSNRHLLNAAAFPALAAIARLARELAIQPSRTASGLRDRHPARRKGVQQMKKSTWILGIALTCGPLLAQESRGTILGTVIDPQAAAVPGATVVVTNVDTNAAKRTTTNESGYYEVPLLDPGNYSVTAENAGFRKFVHSGIILNVNSRARIDIQLQIGSQAETVTVTAEAPLLETTSASAGRVVDNRQ